jgi:glycerol-3-phosphate dehydrogenase
MDRQQTLEELRSNPRADVLVIGGGINGISVFRELALQGLRVVLVDKADYCSGASAALSRMVHGGLRYLENGEFKLVRESLLERDRLLANAPHYVAPLPTVVPIFDRFSGLANGVVRFLGLSRNPSRRGAIVVKAGLTIYDLFTSSRRKMPRHQFRNRLATLSKWPILNPATLSSATYYDAWVSQPERLGIEMLEDARDGDSDALALNHAKAIRTEDGSYVIRDLIGRSDLAIRPRVIINATGGWIDMTNGALLPPHADVPVLMGGTKGSHLIVDNAELRDALDGHMIYYENEDGRICILFPYLGKVLIGSTDIRVDNPDTVRCEPDERDYILQSLAFVLPGIAIKREEIVFQFSGVRPLPSSEDSFTGRIPRDHFCTWLYAASAELPILCMIGGKWTTFRSFGELAADMVLERLGRNRSVRTENVAIGGGRDFPKETAAWIRNLAKQVSFPTNRIATLFGRYGTRADKIVRFIASGNDLPMPHPDYSSREIEYLIRNEAGERLDDILLRRTTLAITGELSMAMVDAVLDIMAETMNWTDSQRDREKSWFLANLLERHGIDQQTLATRNEKRI